MKPKFDCIYHLLVLVCILTTVQACSIIRSNSDKGPEIVVAGDPLDFEVNYVYRSRGQGPLKPLGDETILYPGDHYKIKFTPHEASYVYIFEIDNSQNIDQLFPKTGSTDLTLQNPVRPEHSYILPPSEPFKLDKQRGKKTIYFMAFHQPNQELEKQYTDYLEAYHQNNSILTKKLGDQFAQDLNKLKPVTIVADSEKAQTSFPWSNKETFRVPVQRLNNLCSQCVSVITFEYH